MNKKKFTFLLILSVILYTILNIAHPVTPSYIREKGLPDWSFGIFFAAMSLGTLIFAPIWGALGDKHGRRIPMLIGAIMYGVGQVMFGLFSSVISITFARFFAGSFSAAIKVGMLSYIVGASSFKELDKSKLISYYISTTLIGGSLGSFVGGQLGTLFGNHYEMVIFIQAAALAVFAIIFFFVMPMTDDKTNIEETNRKNVFSSFLQLKKLSPWYLVFFVVIGLCAIVFTDVPKYLDFYFGDNNLDTAALGNFGLVTGLVTLATNIFITPFLIKKLGALKASYITAIIGGVAVLVSFSMTNFLLSVYTIYLLFIISKAVTEPATAYFLNHNEDLNKGILYGMRESFIALGAIIGSVSGGFIYGYNNKLLFFICAGVYIFAGIIIILLARIRHKKINKLKEA